MATNEQMGEHALAAVEELQAQLAAQQQKAQQQAQHLEILQSATWRTLVSQSRWDLWFAQQAKHLQTEVERYREALQETASQNTAQIQQG